MKKFWRVFAYEYARHVLRRRFLFALLSVPILIAVIIGVMFMVMKSEVDGRPVGYVDDSGLLADPLPAPQPEEPDIPVEMRAFPSEAEAERSLQNGQIQAYYVLPADYLQTGKARAVGLGDLKRSARNQFASFVRANLLAGESPEIARRFLEGDHLTVRSPDGSREMGDDSWFNILTPFFAGLIFMIAAFTASGYLMQAMVEEKENRTMEVMVTSLSPMQLMGGKILGDLCVGLTQMAAWIGMAVIVILVGRTQFSLLRSINLPLVDAALMLSVMLPGFLLLAALMAMIGAIVSEEREGQQLTALVTLPAIAPYYLFTVLMNYPNGPIATGLSFFPLTAPITMSMRLAFGGVPRWQFAAVSAILVFSALGAMWLAARAFRLGMLRYGKNLSLREIFARSA